MQQIFLILWNLHKTRLFSSAPAFPNALALRHVFDDTNKRGLASKTKRLRPPKGPIVLCHGLFGFDKIGPEWLPMLQVHYWKGIEDALKNMGCNVYVGRVPRTGGVEERAWELKRMIERTCHSEKHGVNLVAHSMVFASLLTQKGRA